MIYVYAITDPEAEPPAESGFEGARLRAVRAGRLAAIVSDLDERVEPVESTLWQHESVVEALMEVSTVLPMRFGSTLADESALAATLREREDELVRGLDRVRGAVELGVRALWEADEETNGEEPEEALAAAEAAPGAPRATADAGGDAGTAVSPATAGGGGAGTTYLMRRLGRSRRSDALAERIHAPLERIARASTRRVLSVPRVALTAAYLVDEARVDDFRAAVEELDERVAEAAILCTGPWPPYSFAPSEGGA